MLDEHERLLDDDSSLNLNADSNEKQHDDAGVPVMWNYHPRLNGTFKVSCLLLYILTYFQSSYSM